MERKQVVIPLVMVIILLAALSRSFAAGHFDAVRDVDMLLLFANGMAFGVLLVAARRFFRERTG